MGECPICKAIRTHVCPELGSKCTELLNKFTSEKISSDEFIDSLEKEYGKDVIVKIQKGLEKAFNL
jgi:hypothetical protein